MKRFESLSIALLDQIESNVCEYNDKDVDEDDNEMKKVPDMAGECFWNHFCIFHAANFKLDSSSKFKLFLIPRRPVKATTNLLVKCYCRRKQCQWHTTEYEV
jgi:hypothetical protein